MNRHPARRNALRRYIYEITFRGEADRLIRAEFDDCEVITGSGMTTLRAELPDQGARLGLVHRVTGLGLEVTALNLVDAPQGDE